MKKIFILPLTLIMFLAVVGSASAKSTGEYIADLSPEKDSKIIVKAAEWAANTKEKAAIDKLLVLLTDKRETVRLGSVIALGYIGEKSVAKNLNNTMLNDTSSDVRYAAVLSVVRLGSEDSLKALKEAMEKEQDPYIKDFLTKMKKKYDK